MCVQFLLRADTIQALVVTNYFPIPRLASSLASAANMLTLSSLQTLHPVKRGISSKKSPVTPSTSVTCISKNMVSLSGFLNPTGHFLAHTDIGIGDVGIFTSDGGFDFLFNICLPAGHPNNPDELPEGFSCLVLRPRDVTAFCAHPPHSHMSSTSVRKRE